MEVEFKDQKAKSSWTMFWLRSMAPMFKRIARSLRYSSFLDLYQVIESGPEGQSDQLSNYVDDWADPGYSRRFEGSCHE